MQNRVQSAKKPCGLFTFGWSLLCWPSYRDTLFISLARKAATSSCLVLFIQGVTMEVPVPCSFTHSLVWEVFFWNLVCLPSPLPFGWELVGDSGIRCLGRCWVQTDFFVLNERLFEVTWIFSWCKHKQVEQWGICWLDNSIFPKLNLGKVAWSKWKVLQW